jgi:hypothetical protein
MQEYCCAEHGLWFSVKDIDCLAPNLSVDKWDFIFITENWSDIDKFAVFSQKID